MANWSSAASTIRSDRLVCFRAAEGEVHYLGDRRIRLEVGSHQHEATIRDRMARVWETKRTGRSRSIIYGRGSFDNKAALASTVIALRALAATGVRLGGTLVGAYVADEEESATGAEALCVGPDSLLGQRGFPCALGRNRAEAARHPLVASALGASERALGFQPDIETAPGGTDATVMIHAGHIPTLVEMGAAGGLSHDYHEFVERDMIGAGAKVLALMAIDVLGLAEES